MTSSSPPLPVSQNDAAWAAFVATGSCGPWLHPSAEAPDEPLAAEARRLAFAGAASGVIAVFERRGDAPGAAVGSFVHDGRTACLLGGTTADPRFGSPMPFARLARELMANIGLTDADNGAITIPHDVLTAIVLALSSPEGAPRRETARSRLERYAGDAAVAILDGLEQDGFVAVDDDTLRPGPRVTEEPALTAAASGFALDVVAMPPGDRAPDTTPRRLTLLGPPGERFVVHPVPDSETDVVVRRMGVEECATVLTLHLLGDDDLIAIFPAGTRVEQATSPAQDVRRPVTGLDTEDDDLGRTLSAPAMAFRIAADAAVRRLSGLSAGAGGAWSWVLDGDTVVASSMEGADWAQACAGLDAEFGGVPGEPLPQPPADAPFLPIAEHLAKLGVDLGETRRRRLLLSWHDETGVSVRGATVVDAGSHGAWLYDGEAAPSLIPLAAGTVAAWVRDAGVDVAGL